MRDGSVHRDLLKEWIATDTTALGKIEKVVHPLVAADRARFIEENATAPIVLLDIPLLFETGGAAKMDAVVVVSAPAEVQRSRVLERGTMTVEQFELILSKQVPDAQKRAQADYVIETTSLEAAEQAVQDVLADIHKRIDHA